MSLNIIPSTIVNFNCLFSAKIIEKKNSYNNRTVISATTHCDTSFKNNLFLDQVSFMRC